MGSTLLIKDALTIATVDAEGRELTGHDILIEGNVITAIAEDITPPDGARVIDASRCLVVPGLVNTHHHLYQVLTRVVPAVQDAKLFDWLVHLYEIWKGIDPSDVLVSAKAGLAELLLTGCTTASDHLYLYPEGAGNELLEAELRAALELGIRFHPTRGSMSRSKKHGGLPPDSVVQDHDTILRQSEEAVAAFHDPSRLSMCRIALAPCSPFSVTGEIMKESADLARRLGVRLHTHLAETFDENDYCLEVYGKRPLAYMEEVGWIGDDVWFAHGVHFDDAELDLLAKTGTGVAHCPTSNLRLGSGIARVPDMIKRDVPVGLGVDGSASNDSSNMLREAQIAMLVHRVGTGVDAMPARDALMIATKGGARVLGMDDGVGSIEVGKGADIALFDMDDLGYAGAMADPVAALMFCGTTQRARYVVVDGVVRVDDFALVDHDELTLKREADEHARRLHAKALG